MSAIQTVPFAEATLQSETPSVAHSYYNFAFSFVLGRPFRKRSNNTTSAAHHRSCASFDSLFHASAIACAIDNVGEAGAGGCERLLGLGDGEGGLESCAICELGD